MISSNDAQGSSPAFEPMVDPAGKPGAASLVPAAQPGLRQVVPQALAAPGWYAEPDAPGVLRYWNGTGWEQWRKPLVEAPTVTQGQRSAAVAYVLALFLGMTGAHNFYLGRTGPAIAMLLLWLFGLVTALIVVGDVVLFGLLIWLVVDLCLIPSYVRTSALRAVQRAA